METLRAIKERRSVRKFLNRPVEKEKILLVLEAAMYAPSGLNNQPWRFFVVDDAKTKEALSAQTRYSDIIISAPVCIAIFMDALVGYDRTKDVQAIGACWLGEILKNKRKVNAILNAPDTYELMAVVAVGYPAEEKGAADRKKLEELTTWT